MGHEQGGSDAFARNVSEQEKKAFCATFRADQIAVIAADHAEGFVVVMRLPAMSSERPGRQEPLLNA
jgi:hypothetical protein